ncbi:hypothetical protein [Corynebacterium aurimucosum]
MTTLADLTPEERANCVGMWCDYRPAVGTAGLHDAPEEVITTVILKAGNDYDAEFADEYEVFNTVIGHELAQPEQITPRYDIPRAWHADGTPPAGEWAYANPSDKARMHVRLPDKNTTHRRWVGEWEKA